MKGLLNPFYRVYYSSKGPTEKQEAKTWQVIGRQIKVDQSNFLLAAHHCLKASHYAP